MPNPEISVVVPVYNEEANLEPLFTRLTKVLDQLGRSWEIVFTNDGSRDGSLELLKRFHQQRPQQVRVIDFNGNYGQHTAIIAAFERARGEIIITLDADLQNPPEEIPKLLAKIDEGCDAVGGVRAQRDDSFARRYLSRLINLVRERTTDIRMTDQGCMLRAYRRRVVDAIVRSGERATFIPALAYKFASQNGEVVVAHAARAAGESKYSYYKLVRLNFDLITGFTLVPLQWFTLFAMACATGSLLLVLVLAYMRIFLQDNTNGVFTLFAILFFLVSVCMIGIGLIGEYVGRTYQCVQQRPRYVVREVFEEKS
jgi:undecaprenyl-phosphate 4-deoxy-4-formamido-L-arabinose transferase